jgi:hypothetical protein
VVKALSGLSALDEDMLNTWFVVRPDPDRGLRVGHAAGSSAL